MTNIQIAGLAFIAMLFAGAADSAELCKGCDPVTGLTMREKLQEARAKDVKRIVEEGAARPWDRSDLFKPSASAPKSEIVR